MQLRCKAAVIEWRGPAPFIFAVLPEPAVAEIAAVRRALSYGWGVVPVGAELNGVAFTTSLFPRDGGYLLPLKVAVRKATGVTVGDVVTLVLTVGD